MKKLLRDILKERHPAYAQGVRAALIKGEWVLSPAKYLPREEWENARISLRELLPEGAVVGDESGTGTVHWDGHHLYIAEEQFGCWSGDIESLFRDFDIYLMEEEQ